MSRREKTEFALKGALMDLLRYRFFLSLVTSFLVLTGKANGQNLFRISDIPRGKNITLLPGTELQLDVNVEAQFTATDVPQTLKIETITAPSAGLKGVGVAIFDLSQKNVKNVKLASGDPFLYTFNGLGTIRVAPQKIRNKNSMTAQNQFLKLKSDRPITISR